MEYLDYIIAPEGILIDPEKVRAVEEWKQLTNIKGIQSFLGFVNFYRRFIWDFSKITAPLTYLFFIYFLINACNLKVMVNFTELNDRNQILHWAPARLCPSPGRRLWGP
jgi:hypothetical protein